MKTLSIISIIFSTIFFLWYLIFITSNGRISIEEFSLVGVVFGLWCIEFSIVATVNSFRKKSVS